jgi:hypothetical protein
MEKLFEPMEKVLEPIELDDAELAAVAGGIGNVTIGGNLTNNGNATASGTNSNAHITQSQ